MQTCRRPLDTVPGYGVTLRTYRGTTASGLHPTIAMHFFRRTRRLTALTLLVTLLFAHSALAVAACLEHFQGAEQASSHAAHGYTGHSHSANPAGQFIPEEHAGQPHEAQPSDNLLCQIGCEVQAQARDYVKAFEIPAPVAGRAYLLAPTVLVLAWHIADLDSPPQYVAAAPPPLPRTILFSRFLI